MIIHRHTFDLLVALSLSGCGVSPPPASEQGEASSEARPPEPGSEATRDPIAADFRVVCDEAGRALTEQDPDARRSAFARAVESRLATDVVRDAFEAAGMVEDSAKEATLARGANEAGIEGWACPALAEIYGPQTAP